MIIEWNEYHEELLKKWAEMSKTYSIIHSLCAQYYTTWNKRLGVPIIIIGGVTASSILSNKNSSLAWTYINGALALLMTVLSGISNFLGILEKINKHQTASFKYSKISMDIDMILSFGRLNRNISPDDFIHEIKISILNCRENAPEILPWIMAEYINKLDKSITDTNTQINNEVNDFEEKYNEKIIENLPQQSSSQQESISQNVTQIENISENKQNVQKPENEIRKSLHLSLSDKKYTMSGRTHSDFTDKMSLEMIKTGKKIAHIHNIYGHSQTSKTAKTGKSVQSAKSTNHSLYGENSSEEKENENSDSTQIKNTNEIV